MGVFPVSVMCDAHICILISVNCVTTPLKVTHVVYFIKRESKGKYVTTPPAVFDQHTICDRNTTGGTISKNTRDQYNNTDTKDYATMFI